MRIVVMGVAGCGKSTVGALLAQRLGLPFVDGDDLHPAANKAKMARGEPLTDDDRWPWLDALNEAMRARPDGVVLAASALTPAHRARMTDGLDDVRYVLLDAPPEVLAARLARRRDHFAGPTLLPSQLSLLDPPPSAIRADATRPVGVLVDDLAAQLRPA